MVPLSKLIDARGRGGKLQVSGHVSLGRVVVRLDNERHPEFWAELVLPADALAGFLHLIRAGQLLDPTGQVDETDCLLNNPPPPGYGDPAGPPTR